MRRVVTAVLALACAAGCYFCRPWVRRLLRNATLPDVPPPLAPAYPPCSDAELVESVSLVVTVKDTCAQAEPLLRHVASLFPRGMRVYYGYPDIRGCRHVDVDSVGRSLFENFTLVKTQRNDAPIAGFLKIQPLLKTKYAVLMHNDAYPMERDFACESFRALEAHPHYPIVAPQIYERAENGIIVPHGHHENLHMRPVRSGEGHRIDYDLSMDLLTQRLPADFREGPQVDFLEDHAFVARSDRYHELLDPAGSFTMEYMDMILNMRARNTSAWYVPTARVYFEVDTSLLTWEDIPYFVYKRSEQIGHQVRVYLTNKWGIAFPNTGIWNYVRYVFVPFIMLEGASLPQDWSDQAAIFYSFFESVGFNRYNGEYFPDFIEEPSSGAVTMRRETKHDLPTDVPPHRVPPQSASEILPLQGKKAMLVPEISFDEPHIPIGLRTRSCDPSDPSTYALCGMAVQDGDNCTCWTYVEGFNLRTTFYLDKLMELLKLPARAFTYAQMKWWTKPVGSDNTDFFCAATQEECVLKTRFSRSARLLQWSWFGKGPASAFTPEGFTFAVSTLASTLLVLAGRLSFGRIRPGKSEGVTA